MLKITVIYGQRHKGNTWTLTQLFLERLKTIGAQIEEFFLPDDKLLYCIGCMNCIMKEEKLCPHNETIQKIADLVDRADLIIIASPCYVFSMTGQLKTMFDHFGYRFMAHRPEASMFKKQALVLSTAAGAGINKTNKAIAFNLFMWGVARIYQFGVRINSADYGSIPANRKMKIEQKADKITKKIMRNNVRIKPEFKTRFMFFIMRLNQKKNDWNAADKDYWKSQGWINDKKPWK